jgi:hypothetical protein
VGLFGINTSDWLDGTATVVAERDNRLDLQITVPNRASYTLENKKEDVPASLRGALQGRTLPVKVHPEKDDKIEIAWDLLAGTVSLQPSSPDDLPRTTTFTMPVQVSRETRVIDASNVAGLREDILGALAEHGINVDVAQGATFGVSAPSAEDPLDRLKKLGDLHTAGVLTDAEFEAEKKKILGEE